MNKRPLKVIGSNISQNKRGKKSYKKKGKIKLTFLQRVALWLIPSPNAQKSINKSKFLPVIRFIISVFNGYYAFYYLAVIIILILVVFSGKLFTPEGLLVVSIFLFYLIVYLLDKWLKRIDDN